jgi:hypothetical protein
MIIAISAVIVSTLLVSSASESIAQAGDALAILGEALQKAKHCVNHDGRVGEEYCQPARTEAIKHIRIAIDQLKKDIGQ